MTKYYYNTKTKEYIALHKVTPKDVPAGYVEVSEKEYNDYQFALKFDNDNYGEDDGEVIGLK